MLKAFDLIPAGLYYACVWPDMDFETYSEAGFFWSWEKNKWGGPPNASSKKGLGAVGTAKYAEHKSTEVLSLAYDLKNGEGKKLWLPGQPSPLDLITHVINGGIIEAWNSLFEYYIWNKVCVPKYNFPLLNYTQLRCAMAKARAHSLPGKLDETAKVLNLKNKKDKNGARLLKKFSVPRDPTKTNLNLRNLLNENEADAQKLYNYNLADIAAESEASQLIPELIPDELAFWLCDQKINIRGLHVDIESINNCICVLEQAYEKYNSELKLLTNNEVPAASQVAKLKKWLYTKYNITALDLNTDTIYLLLARDDVPKEAKKALKIREMLGSASVKKVYTISYQATQDNRLHNLFIYHSARTGRAAGAGPQPQNLPNSGSKTFKCKTCNAHSGHETFCPACGIENQNVEMEWDLETTEQALKLIATRALSCVEYFWGDAVALISSCLRGLFTPAPGHDLIGADYSAIEAVVLAALAGENWRLEVFKTHGKIYEMSASKITGVPFEEFEKYKIKNNQDHPLRKKIGKVAELASGYQGGINSWKKFGAHKFFKDDEAIKSAVKKWRQDSPKIVEMWGGQYRNYREEFYGLEGAAIQAVLTPGKSFNYNGIEYLTHDNILYCKLLSGRYIVYHKPQLTRDAYFKNSLILSFEGWNSNSLYGTVGWKRIKTYGGRLTENVVQATARDILAHAIINLEKANYPVVLHVHDEIVAEIPETFGTLKEFETIMSIMPPWAKDWPIYARDTWRGKRYG